MLSTGMYLTVAHSEQIDVQASSDIACIMIWVNPGGEKTFEVTFRPHVATASGFSFKPLLRPVPSPLASICKRLA